MLIALNTNMFILKYFFNRSIHVVIYIVKDFDSKSEHLLRNKSIIHVNRKKHSFHKTKFYIQSVEDMGVE